MALFLLLGTISIFHSCMDMYICIDTYCFHEYSGTSSVDFS